MTKKYKNYIAGLFQDPLSQQWSPVINPATQKAFACSPHSHTDDVLQAVAAAKGAYGLWSKTSVEKRSAILLQIAGLIENHFEAFALLETQDNGKPLWLSKQVDIPRAIENFRFFAKHIVEVQDSKEVQEGRAASLITRMPVGVAALITPWNLPLYLLTWKIAPALACGNTVVCKPSEVTPMTAHLLAEIMDQSELPKGACNFVFGTGVQVGKPLVAHEDVRLVSFTGGTQTGRQIEKDIAGQCKKTSFELGGKNPIIIAPDVDISKTVDWVVQASFLNQGQICLCGERIIVHEDILAVFMQQFIEKTKAIKVGDPLDDHNFMGPLISKEHLNKVKAAIAKRIRAGAILVAGDEVLDSKQGFYHRPTILTGLDVENAAHHEEVFGPVVTVESYANSDAVIEMLNQSPYGLCASIFCEDQTKAQEMARKIEAATVWVNCWLIRDLRVPFGGMKQSGLGREGGTYSVDFYTEYKTISTGAKT